MSACMEAWPAWLQLRVGWQLHVANLNNHEKGEFYKRMRRFLKSKAAWECIKGFTTAYYVFTQIKAS